MHQFDSLPLLAAVADRVLTGHLWLTEYLAGGHLRFQMQPSGLLQFGDRTTVYDDPEVLPPQYRLAVRSVREQFDREAFRSFDIDPSAVVFHGVATFTTGFAYNWDQLPPFVGHDVWVSDAEQYRPPDAVDTIFETLGLEAVNTIARERRARDFDPTAYTVPPSAWGDRTAAGVVVRDKTTGRGVIWPDTAPTSNVPHETDLETLVTEFVTPACLDRIAATITSPLTVEQLATRVHEHLWHEVFGSVIEVEPPVALDVIRQECRTYLAAD